MWFPLGVGKRFAPEGSGEFYCKACDRVSRFIYLRARPYLYVAYLPIFSMGQGERLVQCLGCKKHFAESIFNEGSPLIFLTSVLELDGSVAYGMPSHELELPADSEWALGCWFDGFWYPVALGRQRGDRQLALFADRGCFWLDNKYIAPMDVRVGDEALIAEPPTNIDLAGDVEAFRYHPVRLLTWEPDFRRTVIEYRNGVRELVTRWAICFQRPVRWRPKLGDHVLAYRNEGAYFPGTVIQVHPRVEVRFDDAIVLPIRNRLIEPLDLPVNGEVLVRNYNGYEYANGQIVSRHEGALVIRLESGEMETFSLDRIAVPSQSFMPSDEDLRSFFESPAGPLDGADWSSNNSKLSQAIQAFVRDRVAASEDDSRFRG